MFGQDLEFSSWVLLGWFLLVISPVAAVMVIGFVTALVTGWISKTAGVVVGFGWGWLIYILAAAIGDLVQKEWSG